QSEFVPDVSTHDLSLFGRQFAEATHCQAFVWAFARRSFEPAFRFQLTRQAPPQTPPIVQGLVAKGADAIVLRFLRRLRPLHKSEERGLQNILSLAVAQTQRAAVKNPFGSVGSVQG